MTTPLTTFTTKTIDPDIEIIHITDIACRIEFYRSTNRYSTTACSNRHLEMYEMKRPQNHIWYYNKVPIKKIKTRKRLMFILTDPMLATGNSLLGAVELYVNKKEYPLKISNVFV